MLHFKKKKFSAHTTLVNGLWTDKAKIYIVLHIQHITGTIEGILIQRWTRKF